MSDLRASMRPALAGKQPISDPDFSLRALPEGHVIHVLAKSGAGPGPVLKELSAEGRQIRQAAPGQWFIVGDEPLTRAELSALASRLAPDAACVDQSGGRVRILISGPKVERVLGRFTGADLGLAAFPIGHATTSLLGHIAAHVTRVSDSAFEIMVLRSFAESLWDTLSPTSGGGALRPPGHELSQMAHGGSRRLE